MPKSAQGQPNPLVLLMDNGSLAPASTLGLRRVAAHLAERTDREIRPVSLLHSSGLDPALLAGQPAEILEPTLRQLAAHGHFHFVVVPFFLGPSAALTEYLPGRVRQLREAWPDLRVHLAPCLVDTTQPDDLRLAQLLADRVRKTASESSFIHPTIAVVDHGSPQPAVQAVRELITDQIRDLLGGFAKKVIACSMERRPGPEYAFNEPLLETLLETPDFLSGEVIIARLFLLTGRHAGPGGDIERIGQKALSQHPGLKISYVEPLGSHPGLLPILAERIEQGLHTPALA